MSSITYGYSGATAERAAPRSRGLFLRVIDAIAAARMRAAEREIARLRHLLSPEFEHGTWKVTARSEDSLPFVR